ncbi:hypothetical protein PGT21_035947 [Puccinia graminis f. sp. tritici]|uniref:Uncharacterized protein n=1 Tax=Puccinia graminis f. sp. tritici TaxID=56615 RepID=A0A5B0NSV9_PUCGR|nr:hypothetical protein PGTUg99_037219 [Puccinia graminis f. sp. tritici]KAA1091584.1 hypothetical protein PGT21_035947 [Puccinia graminis f. sp. tritici]
MLSLLKHQKIFSLVLLTVCCLQTTQSVDLLQALHAANDQRPIGGESHLDIDQPELEHLQHASHPGLAQYEIQPYKDQQNQLEQVQNVVNHYPAYHEIHIDIDQIELTKMRNTEDKDLSQHEHQGDEENNHEKEKFEKMISSIPPLTKGTRYGLARQYVKQPEKKKAEKMLMDYMQEEFKSLEKELDGLVEGGTKDADTIKHARKIKKIYKEIKIYIQNWLLLKQNPKGLEIQPRTSILDDMKHTLGQMNKFTMESLGNLKYGVEDIITRSGIKSRKFSNAGENSTQMQTWKEHSKQTNSPVEGSNNMFIPQDIFESIMKILVRDLAQQLLNQQDMNSYLQKI